MDLIDRQAAIDGIESFRPIKPTRGETSMEAVNRSAWECAINCVESFVRTMQPSAQPEIIRCKDCKHQEKFFHTDGRRKGGGYYIYGCDFAEGYSHVCLDDDFCSRAERRTDE